MSMEQRLLSNALALVFCFDPTRVGARRNSGYFSGTCRRIQSEVPDFISLKVNICTRVMHA